MRGGREAGGIFPAFLASWEEERTGLYLVTAGGHPCKRRTRTFDLLFRGTERGLLSAVDIRWPCWLLLYWDGDTEDLTWGIVGFPVSSNSCCPEAVTIHRLSRMGDLSALHDSMGSLVSIAGGPCGVLFRLVTVSTFFMTTPEWPSSDPQPHTHMSMLVSNSCSPAPG